MIFNEDFLNTSYMPEIQAHRGSKGSRVENTIEAFKKAILDKADTIELDVHLTKDRQFVVNHDFDIPDLKDGNKKKLIKELEYSQIFEISKMTQNKFGETLYPLLTDVFKWFKKEVLPESDRKILDIEIKFDKKMSFSSATLTDVMLTQITKFNLNENVRIRSFYPRVFWRLKKKFSKNRIILLTDKRIWFWPFYARLMGAKIVAPRINRVNKTAMFFSRLFGLKVFVWGANENFEFEKLVNLNVDAITTDYPERLKIFLESRG